jgi:alkylation response protein AidB-like acyl-CoA dehydrogenase
MLDETGYREFREQIKGAIWRDLDPLEDEIETTGTLPKDRLFPILREIRAFGLLIPARYNGVGLSVSQYVPILAEFAKIQGGIRALVHVHNSIGHAVSELGSEEQRDRVLPGVADGTNSVAFALTEPDHGTGADLGTTAMPDGDAFRLNGRKWLITNSDFASHFMVFAKTSARAVTAFLVERDTEGFTIEDMPETMGCRGGAHSMLRFDDARVPRDAVIGAEGRGLEQMQQALEISRVFVAAASLGTAERALELSIAFAKQRVTFGKPIGERQGVQRYLAEMATDVYALRQMIRDAAAKWDRGQRIPAEASMCKLFGLEAVGRVTDRALLVHGGIGYTRRHRIERLYRDARLNWLEEGTPTIQYMVTASELLSEGSEQPVGL